jgi:hypothetical protein
MAYTKIGDADPRHTTLQKGFNLRWPLGNVQGESSPNGAAFIYICHNEQDIMDAAQDALAAENGRITVRSGGHCYEGFVSNRLSDEVLSILDIGLMTGMDYDEGGNVGSSLVPSAPYRYKFRTSAGNQNWDGYVALYKESGKTIPGGSCYSVGAGGHICGGGYGFLSRMHGLTCDWLAGVDILVPVNRTLVARHVSRESPNSDERDLLAACSGGGGGQFGIITSYYFKDLPTAPKEVLWLPLEFDVPDEPALKKLLQTYYQWFDENKLDRKTWGLATKLELRHFNSGPHTLGIHYVDPNGEISDRQPFDDFVETMLGAIPEIRESLMPPEVYYIPHGKSPTGRKIANIREAQGFARRMDWLPFTQMVNGSGPNQRGRYKSAYQKGNFTDTVVQGIWNALTRPDPNHHQTQSLLQIQSYGGKINDPGEEDRAFSSAAQRSSVLKWQPQTYWTEADEAADAEHAAWIRGLYQDAFSATNGIPLDVNFEGCYINYPDLDMTYIGGLPENGHNPNWWEIYFPDAAIRQRLRSTKVVWDPGNLFRNQMSVPSTGK